MTVLIGMFLLGFLIGLATWALSLERPLQAASSWSRSSSIAQATQAGVDAAADPSGSGVEIRR